MKKLLCSSKYLISLVTQKTQNLYKNKATAAAVISRLRIGNNGELKELEEGVKGKSQQLEKSLRPLLPLSCFTFGTPIVAMIREI